MPDQNVKLEMVVTTDAAGAITGVKNIAASYDKLKSSLDSVKGSAQNLQVSTNGLVKEMAAAATAILGISSLFQGLKDGIWKGIEAVNNYKTNMASLAAITMTFMEKQKDQDMGESWKTAKGYAQGLTEKLEELSAQTLISGGNLRLLATMFTQGSVGIDTGCNPLGVYHQRMQAIYRGQKAGYDV